MRELRRLAWAAVVAAATAGTGVAQVGNGGISTTGSAATSGGFGTGVGGGGNGGGGIGGNGAGGTGSGQLSGTALSGTALSTMQSAPNLALSTTNTTTSTVVSQSNVLGRFYANPYYLGIYTNSINASAQPGGFGTTLYQTGGGTAGGQIGLAGGMPGAGGAGGRGGIGGANGSTVSASITDAGGVLIPLPRQIAYPAQVRFAVIPAAQSQVLADLRGVIDRTPMLTNPAGVQIQMEGNTVLLRGSVRDEDEARLVEGLVRLTPGVGLIKNDLSFPRP